ncbi:MAG: right-handed parallel beta-helix repeat-containing protein, partial [Candidatus Aenigmarchaeota archaeon]|nr:right-handed parallel beta-helix repeat-containing protein [Candidatus Aenigmarchaeota archaeon]
RAVDNAEPSNSNSAPFGAGFIFYIDTTPPTVSITLPANTTYNYNTSLRLNYTATDASSMSICKYSLDDATNVTFTNCDTNTTFNATQGWHKIFVYVNDTGGNNASVSVNFTVDSIPIYINIISPTNRTYNASYPANFTLNYTVSESPSNCSLEKNGVNTTLSSCNNATFLATQGWNTIVVWANDSANNWNASARVNFTYDNISMQLAIQNPINRTYNASYSANFTLNYTVSEAPSNCSYSINGGLNITLTGCNNGTLIAAQGLNTIFLWVNDSANNWNYTNVTFTYDNISIAITFVSPTPNNETVAYNYAYINVTTSETPDWIRLEWNGTNETLSGSGLSWYKNETSLANYNYTFRVYANDSAGNMNVSETRWVNVAVSADVLPPNITLASPINTTYDYMNISLSYAARDDYLVSMCWYKLSGGTNTTLPNCQNTSVMFNEGFNQLDVYLNDSAGRVNSTSVNFTTQFSTDYPEYLGRNMYSQNLYNKSYMYAMRFYADASMAGFNVSFYGRRVGAVEPMVAELYSDSNGDLGSQLESVQNHTAITSGVSWQPAFRFTTSITKGSWYWIRFYPNKASSSNATYYTMYFNTPRMNDAAVKYSTNGWTSTTEYAQSMLWVSNSTGNATLYPYQVLSSYNVYSTRVLCQKYTPSADMRINQTFLFIGNRYSNPGALEVRIRDGSCSGSSLAYASYSKADLNGLYYWQPLQLNNTVALRRNKPIYIEVSSPGSNSANYWTLYYISTNPRGKSFNNDTDFASVGGTSYNDRDMPFALDNFKKSEVQNLKYTSVTTSSISGATWQAVRIKPTLDGMLYNISLYLRRVSGTANITACLKQDNGDVPGTNIECVAINPSTTIGWANASFTSSVSANTAYWIVLNTTSGTTHYIQPLYLTGSDNYIKQSANSGSSWATAAYDAPIIVYTTTQTQKNVVVSAGAASVYSVYNKSQSFTTTTTTNFEGLLLHLYRDYRTMKNLSVQIVTDSGGFPSSSVVASGTLVFNKTSLYQGVHKVSFSSPVQLTQGTRYHIVLSNAYNSPDVYYWEYNYYNPKQDGFQSTTSRYCYRSGSWSCDDRYDFEFALLSSSEVPTNDTQAPFVSIIYPTNNQYINVTAVNVTFFASDNLAATLNCSLYTGSGATANQTNETVVSGRLRKFTMVGLLSSSPYNVYITCKDSVGNIGQSSTVRFTVDRTTPTASMRSPRANSAVNGNVTVTAYVTDTISGIFNVTFQWTNRTDYWTDISTVPGQPASSRYYTVILDTSMFVNGDNITLRAVPVDKAGNANHSAQNVTVRIDHNAPIVQNITVTYPVGQSQARNSQNAVFRLNATDVSGAGMNYVSANLTDVNGTSYANMTLQTGALRQAYIWTGWNMTANIIKTDSGEVLAEIIAADNATPTNNLADGQYFMFDVDNEAPKFYNNNTIIDNASRTIEQDVFWTDNYNLSGYIFSSNYSGVWENDSFVEVGENETWTNITIAAPNSPGAYGWIIYMNDSAGNMNSTGLQAVDVPDLVPPEVVITSPENIIYNTTMIELIYSVTDNYEVDSCWYSLNNGGNTTLSGCGGANITAAEGENTLVVYANDSSNNVGSDAVDFTVATRILITIASPTNTTYNYNSSMPLEYTVYGGAIDSCWYNLDNGANTTLTNCGNATFNTSIGWHSLTFYSNNSLAVMNVSNVNFTVSAGGIGVSSCGSLGISDWVYVLTRDLNSTGTCITIGANNVTLDCNGYLINYSQLTTGYAVTATSKNYTTIKNCVVIQGNDTITASHGIYMNTGVGGANIYNNTIRLLHKNSTGWNNSAHGIYMMTRVYNVSIYNNTLTAVGNSSTGVYLADSSNSSVYSNTINNTAMTDGRGILLQAAYNNSAYSNIVMTSAYGIMLQYTSFGNKIYSNTVNMTSTWAYGVYLYSVSYNNLVYNNIISTNSTGAGGVSLGETAYNNSVYSNNITTTSTSSAYGMHLHKTVFNNTFWNNTIRASSTRIMLDGSAGTVDSNVFENDTLIRESTTGYDVYAVSSSQNSFIGAVINRSNIYIGSSVVNLSIKWFVRVNVTESDGKVLRATVNFTNMNGARVSIVDTGDSGLTPWFTVSEVEMGSSGNREYNNHSVTVNRSGYTVQKSLNITNNTQIDIILIMVFPINVAIELEFNISGVSGDTGYVSGNTDLGTYLKSGLDHDYTCVDDTTISGTPALGIVFYGNEFHYITMAKPNSYGLKLSQSIAGNKFMIPFVSSCGEIKGKMLQIEAGQGILRFGAADTGKTYPIEIYIDYPFDINGSYELRGNIELVLERTSTGVVVRKK